MVTDGHVAHQRRLLFEQAAHVIELTLGREFLQSIQQILLGKERSVMQLLDDAEELESMLIADPDRDRHGYDPAEYGRPVCDDEILV